MVSPLADLEVTIGELRREGSRLVVTSGAGSTLPATIYLQPHDVARAAGLVLRRPAVWAFLLALPWLLRRKPPEAPAVARDVNDPWQDP